MDSQNATGPTTLPFLSARLSEMEKRYNQLGERKKRRLTIPAIFGRSGDENFISDYLAYILDPERNGVGIEPLQVLLSLAYEDILEVDTAQTNIIREYTFRKKPDCGRIDFVIELGENGMDGVIGIENKIYASEGENQTCAYVNGLQEEYKGRPLYMIFLTPNGRPPAAQEFKPVSYADLARELRGVQYPVLNDIHKTVIWEDFLYHLEEYIAMSNGKLELSGKARLYLEHHQMIEEISSAFQEDSQRVYDYVTGCVKNRMGESWNFNFQRSNTYQEISREDWKLEKFYIFFQFFFSRDSLLTKDRFPFMLGVYPRNADSRGFFEWVQAHKLGIKAVCDSFGIEAYPIKIQGTASHIFAYKEYPTVLDREEITNFDQPFIQAVDQFKSFVPIINDAVQAYKTK